MVSNLSTVPTVSLCLGPVAGLGAARAVSSHYSVMVKDLSQLFVAGPPVVNALGVEEVDKRGVTGGSRIQTRNGSIDDEVESEEEAFEAARKFLSIFRLLCLNKQREHLRRIQTFGLIRA